MDRTVSRRSEPSSRTTLMGEQPNPWDLLQPQDVMSRHRTYVTRNPLSNRIDYKFEPKGVLYYHLKPCISYSLLGEVESAREMQRTVLR